MLRKIFITAAICIPLWAACADTPIERAKEALAAYNLDEAESILDDIEAAHRRNRKKNPLPEGIDALRTDIDKIRAMMDRVETVEVIDSVTVPLSSLLSAYNIGASSGSLQPPSALPAGYPAKGTTSLFATEDGNVMLWGAEADGTMAIFEADRLADGSLTQASKIKGELGDGNLNYPFLLPDGVTLYFASTDPSGLGGYDIMMTRKEEDSWLLPQNIGMPYNSPANDYLYAVDEERGVGFWATDRNAHPGMVTVYTFIPRDMRQNYDPDLENLPALARLASIRDTQVKGKDYASLLKGIKAGSQAAGNTAAGANAEFAISVPGMGVYRNIGEFASPQARALMEEWLDLRSRSALLADKLQAMRLSYARGDRGLAPEILEAEKTIEQWRAQMRRLSNEIIIAERK